MAKQRKAGKGSDLTAVSGLSKKKVIGDFDESFRSVLIKDCGHRGRVTVLNPRSEDSHRQVGKEPNKDW